MDCSNKARSDTHFEIDGGVCHVTFIGWTSTDLYTYMYIVLFCCCEVITIVLDCVPASGLISMHLCIVLYCAMECPASSFNNWPQTLKPMLSILDFVLTCLQKLCDKICNETLGSRLQMMPSFCPIEVDFTLCVMRLYTTQCLHW